MIAVSSRPPIPPAPSSGGADRSRIDREGFLDLLLSQLTHQDPLQPMSNGEMMQQLLGLEMLSRLQDLGKGIASLRQSLSLTAGALAGRRVEVFDADSGPLQGTVEKVRWQEGEIALVVGGREYPLESLLAVLE